MIAPPCHSRTTASTDDWITPRWLIEQLGPFDLDPCACIPQPWPCAAESWTAEDGGLLRAWPRGSLVWCNPPYGAAMESWLNRLAMHGSGIALVFARTETKAFFRFVWPLASSLLFLRGRLTFHRPDGSKSRSGGNSGGPSVLIGYGPAAGARLQANAQLGAFVALREAGN